MRHFPGSVLFAGLDREHEEPDQQTSWGVKLAVFALETLPETQLDSAGPEIELITTERGGKAIEPRARIGGGVRIGPRDDTDEFISSLEAGGHGRIAPVARLAGALPRGVTTVFRLTEQDGRIGELRVSRAAAEGGGQTPAAASVRLALALEGYVVADAEEELDTIETGERDEAQAPRMILQREVIVLRPRPLPEGCIALFLPSPFESSPAAALALALEIRPAAEWTEADRPLYEAAVLQCAEDLRTAAELAGRRRAGAARGESLPHGLAPALEELEVPLRRRSSLVYLAHAAGARFAVDLALAAPDDLTARLARAVMLGASSEVMEDERAVAWLLERCSYGLLADALTERGTTLDLEGLLAVHAGEVGRHGPILREALDASGSLEEFDARLVEENLRYLEDISPASRSRAFDWLAARGLAPQGYDPLGTVRERRAALTRAAEEAAKAAGTDEESR